MKYVWCYYASIRGLDGEDTDEIDTRISMSDLDEEDTDNIDSHMSISDF